MGRIATPFTFARNLHFRLRYADPYWTYGPAIGDADPKLRNWHLFQLLVVLLQPVFHLATFHQTHDIPLFAAAQTGVAEVDFLHQVRLSLLI